MLWLLLTSDALTRGSYELKKELASAYEHSDHGYQLIEKMAASLAKMDPEPPATKRKLAPPTEGDLLSPLTDLLDMTERTMRGVAQLRDGGNAKARAVAEGRRMIEDAEERARDAEEAAGRYKQRLDDIEEMLGKSGGLDVHGHLAKLQFEISRLERASEQKDSAIEAERLKLMELEDELEEVRTKGDAGVERRLANARKHARRLEEQMSEAMQRLRDCLAALDSTEVEKSKMLKQVRCGSQQTPYLCLRRPSPNFDISLCQASMTFDTLLPSFPLPPDRQQPSLTWYQPTRALGTGARRAQRVRDRQGRVAARARRVRAEREGSSAGGRRAHRRAIHPPSANSRSARRHGARSTAIRGGQGGGACGGGAAWGDAQGRGGGACGESIEWAPPGDGPGRIEYGAQTDSSSAR